MRIGPPRRASPKRPSPSVTAVTARLRRGRAGGVVAAVQAALGEALAGGAARVDLDLDRAHLRREPGDDAALVGGLLDGDARLLLAGAGLDHGVDGGDARLA